MVKRRGRLCRAAAGTVTARSPPGDAFGAIELRAAGLSYDQIAAEVGYANRGTAYNVVPQALAARQAHSADQMRTWNWPASKPPTPPCGHEPCRAIAPPSRRCCASWTWNAGCKASTSRFAKPGPRTTGITAKDPLPS